MNKKYRMAVFFIYETEDMNSQDAVGSVLYALTDGVAADHVRDLSISVKAVILPAQPPRESTKTAETPQGESYDKFKGKP